jgi:uncharacterized membrane protein YfcA
METAFSGEPLLFLFLLAAAFLAGGIDSMAGGGGLISLPAMLLAGLPPHMALGTGKFMACLGTAAACLSFARSGVIVRKVALKGFVAALLGSAVGARAALFVESEALGVVILCLLPLAALITFLPLRREAGEKSAGTASAGTASGAAVLPLCAAVGLYDGFFGPGAGSFYLLTLHLILGLGLVAASGTAKVLNLASNISGLLVFLLHGKIFFALALPMAAANIAGNLVGARLTIAGGPRLVRRMLLVSLTLLFATLLWRQCA